MKRCFVDGFYSGVDGFLSSYRVGELQMESFSGFRVYLHAWLATCMNSWKSQGR
jgi:hypothetical protein